MVMDDKILLGLMQESYCYLTLLNIFYINLEPVDIHDNVMAGRAECFHSSLIIEVAYCFF